MTDTITELQTQIADLTAQKAPLCKYTTQTVCYTGKCGRCSGTGIYSRYHGVCYDCGGNGRGPEWVRERVWPEGATAAQITAWEAEIARRSEVRRLKKALKKAQAAEHKRMIAEAEAVAFINDHKARGVDLAAALETDHDISRDLKAKLWERGWLSQAQVELAIKLQKQTAERAEESAKATPAPAGRVAVHAEIISTRYQVSQYGETPKMLIKDDRGFKVWCSVPSGLKDTSRGARVAITVTLKPSDDDPRFAFGSRPRLAP